MRQALAQRSDEQPNPNRRLWRDLRLLRICGTILFAAIPQAIALTLLMGFELTSDLSYLIYNYPLALGWLGIVTCLHLGLVRIQGYVTRRQCLIWGVSTGALAGAIILGLASAASTDDIQSVTVAADAETDWRKAIALLLSLFVPAGLLSGWIYWRFGIRPSSIRPKLQPSNTPDQSPHNAREALSYGAPLDAMSTFFSLVLCALLAAMPMTASAAQSDENISGRVIVVGATSFAIWSIGGGAYARLRRKKSLQECLTLG
jgi:hypothetical protein